MADIKVRNPSNVSIDGVSAGCVLDVCRNHKDHASDVQRAFDARWEALQQEHQDQVRIILSKHEETITELRAYYEALIAKKEQATLAAKKEVEALTADLADARATIANMEAHPDVVTARAAEARDTQEKELANARAVFAKHGIDPK